ncbi:MAG TPA: hypothetical protein VL400_15830 [Polyangiaceae bacterium]|nr:hypothetical protein [Polyangiaceae bacterium]
MTATGGGVAASPAAPAELGIIPDANAFGAAIAPLEPKKRSVRRLHVLLSELDPAVDLIALEIQTIRLGEWIRSGGEAPRLDGTPVSEAPQIRRLRVLVAALEAFPALRAKLGMVLHELLIEQSALPFFAKMGIPGDRGLFAETVDRVSRRLMPQPIDEQDITELVARMFPRAADPPWIAMIPADLALRFIAVLRKPFDLAGAGSVRGSMQSISGNMDLSLGAVPEDPRASSAASSLRMRSLWTPLRVALLDAILLLASRVSSAGLSDEIRARSPKVSLRESPFFKLPRSIDALLATHRADLEEATAWADDCRALVVECREASNAVFDHLEQAGVSVDVVYRLELIEKSLARIELLLELLVPQAKEELARGAVQLFSKLLTERRRQRSLTDILRTNTRLLARKVIERAGQSGEHYITTTPGEYVKMLLSAGGGGVLTAGTVVAKNLIAALKRPPLQDGLLAASNYAGSFLMMQLLGFTLATKQPSMTAAALAGAIKSDGRDHAALVTTMARLVRSQLAAAFGNVGFVIPTAIAVDRYWMYSKGTHLLTAEYGHHFMESMHPSTVAPFAALTGVILWASSLAAGWLENWAVYRRLPEAIAEHRIRRIVGRRVTEWASRVFARNISGIGGNVSVGLMLGLTQTFGTFIGLPLEVRHVTLSTGSLTFSVLAMGSESLHTGDFSAAVLGVGVTLALNLGVSFLLAIVVAFGAREVSFWEAMRLFLALVIGFVKNPIRFFLPIGDKGAPAPHGHGH